MVRPLVSATSPKWIDRGDLGESFAVTKQVEGHLCFQQGCCVRDHKPTLSSPQSTAIQEKTSTDEPADEKTDKEISTENNEEHAKENTGEESNKVLLAAKFKLKYRCLYHNSKPWNKENLNLKVMASLSLAVFDSARSYWELIID